MKDWFTKWFIEPLTVSILFVIMGFTLSLIIASILWGLIHIGS